MDRWAWEQLTPWPHLRATLPVGALFCVLRGPTPREWSAKRPSRRLSSQLLCQGRVAICGFHRVHGMSAGAVPLMRCAGGAVCAGVAGWVV
jgi:hypothetical protein